MIRKHSPHHYEYHDQQDDRRAVVRVALDLARGVALAQPARSSGQRPDKQKCRAAGRRFLFGGPSARQSENDWRWPCRRLRGPLAGPELPLGMGVTKDAHVCGRPSGLEQACAPMELSVKMQQRDLPRTRTEDFPHKVEMVIPIIRFNLGCRVQMSHFP